MRSKSAHFFEDAELARSLHHRVTTSHPCSTRVAGEIMVRELMPAMSALLLVSTPALAAEYEMGNPLGHDGQAEIGVVSDLRYEAGVPVGHDRSVSMVVANGVPYDDPAYTFDDTIGSSTNRSSDDARDVSNGSSGRAAR